MEWVASDGNVECYGEQTDNEIIADIRREKGQEQEEEEDDEEMGGANEDAELSRKSSRQDAIAALATLRAFCDAEICDGYQDLYRLENLVMKHIQTNTIQTKISRFFS